MDINEFMGSNNEKPLDRLVCDGGFCGIFRKIGCVGDSLSSGEFEGTKADGTMSYHDMFDYSWGQYLARISGTFVYNFSRGGMTAKEYCESFADSCGYWNRDLACNAYIIALGVNDMNSDIEIGSVDDIDMNDWRNNKKTFAGYYAQIVQRLKEIQPEAKFLFMTIPVETNIVDEEKIKRLDRHRELLEEMAGKLENSYLLDFRSFAPKYDDEFHKNFFLGGHMNPCGYMLTAKLVASYIDYIIRHNMMDFKRLGFMNTPYNNTAED